MTLGIETASSAGKKVVNLDLLIGNMPRKFNGIPLIIDSAKVLVLHYCAL